MREPYYARRAAILTRHTRDTIVYDILILVASLLIPLLLLGGVFYLAHLGYRALTRGRAPLAVGEGADPPAARLGTQSLRTHPLTGRFMAIGVIALLMLIPLQLVQEMVGERSGLYQGVLDEIAASWGQRQTLTGPVLVVPFIERQERQETVTDLQGKAQTVTRVEEVRRHALLLPESLGLEVGIEDQFRYRGIYQALVYTAAIQVEARFPRLELGGLSDQLVRVEWARAFLSYGLSDTSAIRAVEPLAWDDQPHAMAPGSRLTGLLKQGFHVPLPDLNLDAPDHRMRLKLTLGGSGGLHFAPLGQTSQVRIQSRWPHPSFQGGVLPAQQTIGDQGFTASWSIPHLARNYPQAWVLEREQQNLGELTGGVNLFEPVFLYSRVTRAVKYGLLFVGLTFLTFVIFELTVAARLHYVQYALVGLALAMFFLTLLSLAEHIPFLTAYGAASAVVVVMITLYTGAALGRWGQAAIVGLLLVSLYSVLYALLQMEDYALLVGTALLLVALMVLMYVTRHIQAA